MLDSLLEGTHLEGSTYGFIILLFIIVIVCAYTLFKDDIDTYNTFKTSKFRANKFKDDKSKNDN